MRKLSPNDRLAGAMLFCLKNGVKPVCICAGLAAGLCFDNENDPAALKLQEMIREKGLDAVLADLCGITGNPGEKETIRSFYDMIRSGGDLKYIIDAVRNY